jgi:hypothetical protein
MGLKKFLDQHGIEVIETDAGIHLRSKQVPLVTKVRTVDEVIQEKQDRAQAIRQSLHYGAEASRLFDGVPKSFPGDGVPEGKIDWGTETIPQEDSVAPPVKRGILIGLGGRLRHGKDEVADALVGQYEFQKYGMSDPLNEALLTLNPIVVATTKLDQGGESDRVVSEKVYYRDLHARVGYVEAKKNPEVRRLLQMLGTDVGRKMIDPDIWVKIARERIEKSLSEGKNVVITAIRFPNEVSMVEKLGGALVWVHRPGKEFEPSKDAHASETSVNIQNFPITLHNDGELNQIPFLAETAFKFIKDNIRPEGYTGGFGYSFSAKKLFDDIQKVAKKLNGAAVGIDLEGKVTLAVPKGTLYGKSSDTRRMPRGFSIIGD